MEIRTYTAADKNACIEVFKSNLPKYFDPAELPLFLAWLEKQEIGEPGHSGSLEDHYYVLEMGEKGIVGCGGFYVANDADEVRFAWGMIHSGFHKHKLGTELSKFRILKMKEGWPNHKITLGTSQHTFPFYEKMGMKVVKIIPKGYGEELDRYDMEL